MKYKEFKSFSFEDRDEPISDELLDSAISFDEIMIVPTYEDVEKILYGSDEENEDEESPKGTNEDEPKKSSKKSRHDDDDEEPESSKKSKHEDDDEEEKSEKKSTSGKCPFGHKYGVDTDTFDDCENCNCWDKCCSGK